MWSERVPEPVSYRLVILAVVAAALEGGVELPLPVLLVQQGPAAVAVAGVHLDAEEICADLREGVVPRGVHIGDSEADLEQSVRESPLEGLAPAQVQHQVAGLQPLPRQLDHLGPRVQHHRLRQLGQGEVGGTGRWRVDGPDVDLLLPDLLDGAVVVPEDGVALARLAAVSVKVDLGELCVVEAVVGGGQEARGDQGGAAQEGLGRRG